MRSAAAEAAVLFLVIFGTACGGAKQTLDSVSDAKELPLSSANASAGQIRGVVRFRGAAPAPATQAITKDTQVCGTQVSLTRLEIGTDRGVRRTFVYLDDVPSHQPVQTRLSVLVDQKQCEYVPQMLTVAAGAPLDIVNSDPILHNVHAREKTPEGPQTIFNIAQPLHGQRTAVNVSVMKPGIVVLSCEAGHPWMSAYVFVADHPYVAVTNDDGEFVIEGVPSGTYSIKMWHEGVRVERIIESLQRYEYEDPYELTQEVTVTPGGESVVDFELALRESTKQLDALDSIVPVNAQQ